MNLSSTVDAVVEALAEIKAKDIVVLDVANISTVCDRFIIASGDSNRQVRALARNVALKLKKAGLPATSVEGERYGEWVLVDFGEVVVHLMQPEIRQYYALEQLWHAAP